MTPHRVLLNTKNNTEILAYLCIVVILYHVASKISQFLEEILSHPAKWNKYQKGFNSTIASSE